MPAGLSHPEPACVPAPVESYSHTCRKRTPHGMCMCYWLALFEFSYLKQIGSSQCTFPALGTHEVSQYTIKY